MLEIYMFKVVENVDGSTMVEDDNTNGGERQWWKMLMTIQMVTVQTVESGNGVRCCSQF